MSNVVNIVDNITMQLVSGKEPMDPPDIMEFPELKLIASKTDDRGLTEASLSSPYGKYTLPEAKDLLDGDCFGIKV